VTICDAVLERVRAIEPVYLGPTWLENPDWREGDSILGRYALPERTLGWQQIAWVEANLLADDSTPEEPKPFKLTFEQRRFILWWYAVDDRGVFIFRDGVLQRLKGWGKDPLASVLAAIEFVGPCRFSHWATEDDVKKHPMLGVGDPVAKAHPRSWVQVAAVSKDQTENTMTLFNGMFTAECLKRHMIDVGKEIVYANHGRCRIKAVTSSPRSLEGGRTTFTIRNETHHWIKGNEGHEMASTISNNATKSKDGSARALSITNAYDPSEDSVAQHQREAWEAERAGLAIDTGVLYDSIEAPEDALLALPKNPDGSEPTEDEVKFYLGAVILAIRGDATWLNVERIVKSILDRNNKPSKSRRMWFNQVRATEDAWLEPGAITASSDRLAVESRRVEADALRAGWIVDPKSPSVMFFDGSKSDDATALMGCEVSTGYTFTLGVWQKPPGDAGKGWTVPRYDVDNRVDEVMDRFNIVAFFGDPSHTKDDDATRYWDGLMDDWHRRFKDRLQVWSIKTGDRQHSIMWDMTSPERSKQFVAAAETFVEEMQNRNADDTGYEPLFLHDGHPALVQHLKNAKRYPTRDGISLWKGHRESAQKVDLAVAAVGARMLRRVVQNRGLAEDDKVKAGEVWGA
jgi:hypothetical protein